MDLERIIIDREEGLSKGILKVQKQFEDTLLKILQEFSNKNTLEFDALQLTKLKKAIDDAFDKTSYKKAVDIYLSTFDDIIQDNIEWYKSNKIEAQNYILKSEYFKELRNQTIDNLLNKNIIDIRFKKPIEQIMRLDILRGISYAEAEANLKGKLGKFEPYIKTITMDTLNQYDGAINNDIRKEFKLDTLVYSGSLIDTSRPICTHLHSKRQWTKDELINVLDEYCPNGNPSKSKINYIVNGKEHTTTKGSGMIEDTNVNNFTINRGGHGCRHSARWK